MGHDISDLTEGRFVTWLKLVNDLMTASYALWAVSYLQCLKQEGD